MSRKNGGRSIEQFLHGEPAVRRAEAIHKDRPAAPKKKKKKKVVVAAPKSGSAYEAQALTQSKNLEVLRFPEDKDVMVEWETDRLVKHLVRVAVSEGKPAIMKALVNLERFNKGRNPATARKTRQVINFLKQDTKYQAIEMTIEEERDMRSHGVENFIFGQGEGPKMRSLPPVRSKLISRLSHELHRCGYHIESFVGNEAVFAPSQSASRDGAGRVIRNCQNLRCSVEDQKILVTDEAAVVAEETANEATRSMNVQVIDKINDTMVWDVRTDGKNKAEFDRLMKKHGKDPDMVVQLIDVANDVVYWDNQGSGGKVRKIKRIPATESRIRGDRNPRINKVERVLGKDFERFIDDDDVEGELTFIYEGNEKNTDKIVKLALKALKKAGIKVGAVLIDDLDEDIGIKVSFAFPQSEAFVVPKAGDSQITTRVDVLADDIKEMNAIKMILDKAPEVISLDVDKAARIVRAFLYGWPKKSAVNQVKRILKSKITLTEEVVGVECRGWMEEDGTLTIERMSDNPFPFDDDTGVSHDAVQRALGKQFKFDRRRSNKQKVVFTYIGKDSGKIPVGKVDSLVKRGLAKKRIDATYKVVRPPSSSPFPFDDDTQPRVTVSLSGNEEFVTEEDLGLTLRPFGNKPAEKLSLGSDRRVFLGVLAIGKIVGKGPTVRFKTTTQITVGKDDVRNIQSAVTKIDAMAKPHMSDHGEELVAEAMLDLGIELRPRKDKPSMKVMMMADRRIFLQGNTTMQIGHMRGSAFIATDITVGQEDRRNIESAVKGIDAQAAAAVVKSEATATLKKPNADVIKSAKGIAAKKREDVYVVWRKDAWEFLDEETVERERLTSKDIGAIVTPQGKVESLEDDNDDDPEEEIVNSSLTPAQRFMRGGELQAEGTSVKDDFGVREALEAARLKIDAGFKKGVQVQYTVLASEKEVGKALQKAGFKFKFSSSYKKDETRVDVHQGEEDDESMVVAYPWGTKPKFEGLEVEAGDISKEKMIKLTTRFEVAVGKLMDERGLSAPISLQVMKMLNEVSDELRGELRTTGVDAVNKFLTATNNAGFNSDFAVVNGLVRKYRLKIAPTGKPIPPEIAAEAKKKIAWIDVNTRGMTVRNEGPNGKVIWELPLVKEGKKIDWDASRDEAISKAKGSGFSHWLDEDFEVRVIEEVEAEAKTGTRHDEEIGAFDPSCIIESITVESINDKNILKAVFLAGGPGSGKSFVAKKLFAGSTARFVNSDGFFEMGLTAAKLPFEIDPKKKKVFAKQMEQREFAKVLADSRMGLWLNGLLPLVIDGTGKNFEKIKAQKQALERMGYDTSMVFVNTTLEVAKQRNQMRARVVPDVIVEKGWREVQDNLGKFQNEFGRRSFLIVDNSKVLEGSDLKKFELQLARAAMKMIDGPLRNPKGKALIKLMKDRKATVLSDVAATDVSTSDQVVMSPDPTLQAQLAATLPTGVAAVDVMSDGEGRFAATFVGTGSVLDKLEEQLRGRSDPWDIARKGNRLIVGGFHSAAKSPIDPLPGLSGESEKGREVFIVGHGNKFRIVDAKTERKPRSKKQTVLVDKLETLQDAKAHIKAKGWEEVKESILGDTKFSADKGFDLRTFLQGEEASFRGDARSKKSYSFVLSFPTKNERDKARSALRSAAKSGDYSIQRVKDYSSTSLKQPAIDVTLDGRSGEDGAATLLRQALSKVGIDATP